MNDVIIVVDNPISALAIVAKQRQKYMPCQVIYASEFTSPISLLRSLGRATQRCILFSWRGALKEALLCKQARSLYMELLSTKTIHLLIPDLLGLQEENLEKELALLNSTHGYWVTSAQLFREYTYRFPERKPLGVFHDLPDVEKIRTIRCQENRREGAIWVGNSQWGSSFGFVDHKGLRGIVEPLSASIASSLPIRIIDSSKSRVTNSDVLLEVSKHYFLLHTSASEGTGLPILEALGLGTIPITTDVGIAREILTGEFASLIIPRDIQSFKRKLQELESIDSCLSWECMNLFDTYVERVRTETLTWERNSVFLDREPSSILKELHVSLLWKYRKLRRKAFPNDRK